MTINAKNLKNERVFVDWNGVGDGPFASWHPMIRINAADGKFCYAGVSDPNELEPHESRNLELQCSGSSEKPPKSYDEQSDQNPTSIAISGYSAKHYMSHLFDKHYRELSGNLAPSLPEPIIQ